VRDLVCLVADKNMQAALKGILSRPQSLGIRPISFETIVHPRRDPCCFHESPELLQGYSRDTAHATVLLDLQWAGSPSTATEAENAVEKRLQESSRAGWARAVVIDPELEVWLFAEAPHLEAALGWAGREPSLRSALDSNGLWPRSLVKPADPKRAVEWALRKVAKPRSSSIYRDVADRTSLARCGDRSFLRLKEILRGWFPTREIGAEASHGPDSRGTRRQHDRT